MANITIARARRGVWIRRIAFHLASATGSLLLLTMVLAAFLLASGVLEW